MEELSQIEVTTVSKESTPAFRTPAAIFVVTQEMIRRSGATNIPDVLRLVPGVEVGQIDSGKWAVGIRGFEGRLSKAVRVLIDGRSVYTPLFAGVYWEVQHVMLEDIERIEVVRGPGATIWGSNAVNGVINIITKSATRDARDARLGRDRQCRSRSTGLALRRGQRPLGLSRSTGQVSRAVRSTIPAPGTLMTGEWARSASASIGRRASAIRSLFKATLRTIAGQQLDISTYSPPIAAIVEATGITPGRISGSWRDVLLSGSDIQFQNAYFDRTDRQDLNYREIRDTFDSISFITSPPAATTSSGARARASVPSHTSKPFPRWTSCRTTRPITSSADSFRTRSQSFPTAWR